ncbi:MAG: hypothetical protein HY906_11025 [Deltaproteobacteria bacterium]|nr:hypothetical protein [Deltaproteobacteria bacterium]
MSAVTPEQLARWNQTYGWEENVFDERTLTVGRIGPFGQGEVRRIRTFRQDGAILVRNRIVRLRELFPHMDPVACQAAVNRLTSYLKAAAHAIVVWPEGSPSSERLKVWYYPVTTDDLAAEEAGDASAYPPLRFAVIGQHLERELEPVEIAQLRLRVDTAMERWWRDHHHSVRPE